MPTERRDDAPMLTMLQNVLNDVSAMCRELSDHIASEPADIAEAVRVATLKAVVEHAAHTINAAAHHVK